MHKRRGGKSKQYILAEWTKDGRIRRWRFYIKTRRFPAQDNETQSILNHNRARFDMDTLLVRLPISRGGRVQDFESEIYALLQGYVVLNGGDGDSLRIWLFNAG